MCLLTYTIREEQVLALYLKGYISFYSIHDIPELQFYEHSQFDDINNDVFYPYHYEPETELENFSDFQSIVNDTLIAVCVRYLQGIS